MFAFNNAIFLGSINTTPLIKDAMLCKKGLKNSACKFSPIIRTKCFNIFVEMDIYRFNELGENWQSLKLVGDEVSPSCPTVIINNSYHKPCTIEAVMEIRPP